MPAKRILIVDDEAPLRRLLRDAFLEEPEYEVETAAHGKEAVAKIEECGGRFAAVITDIVMPGMNGEELTRWIKEHFPAVPVVVVTAYPRDASVIRCLEAGASDYVVKPFDIDELKETVDRAVASLERTTVRPGDLSVRSDMEDWIEFNAASEMEYLTRFRQFVLVLLRSHLSPDECEEVRLAIQEIGRNAIEWGNEQDRDKRVVFSYCLFNDRVVFKVADQGRGFDPGAVPDPALDPMGHMERRREQGKRLGGYGIHIVRKVMDEVAYSERGNEVIMTKYLRDKDAASRGPRA